MPMLSRCDPLQHSAVAGATAQSYRQLTINATVGANTGNTAIYCAGQWVMKIHLILFPNNHINGYRDGVWILRLQRYRMGHFR